MILCKTHLRWQTEGKTLVNWKSTGYIDIYNGSVPGRIISQLLSIGQYNRLGLFAMIKNPRTRKRWFIICNGIGYYHNAAPL